MWAESASSAPPGLDGRLLTGAQRGWRGGIAERGAVVGGDASANRAGGAMQRRACMRQQQGVERWALELRHEGHLLRNRFHQEHGGGRCIRTRLSLSEHN